MSETIPRSLTLPIPVVPPFDFESTVSNYGRFAAERVNRYEPGLFRRAFPLNGRPVVAELRWLGTVEEPKLELTVTGEGLTDPEAQAIADRIVFMFGLDEDWTHFHEIARRDPIMLDFTGRLRGLRAIRYPGLWELLVGAIASQQINLGFAAIVRGRLVERFGQAVIHNGQTLWTFPTPEAVMHATVPELMAMQWSGRKAEYLIGLSRAMVEGEIDEAALARLDDEALIASLIRHRGIGRWSAEWALIRGFGRPDSVPLDDVGIQRAVTVFYGVADARGRKATAAQLAEVAEAWRPFRTLGVTYLLAALRFKETPPSE